jgi:molecular chaperone Hsp33
MSDKDQSQRFLFEKTAIRGELISLDQAYLDILSKKQYPKKIQQCLGQFLAAVTLLSSTLKFEGSLILQAKSQGQISLIMAECKNGQFVRAICRYNPNFNPNDALFEQGHLALTLEPLSGQPYQSMIPLHEDDISMGIQDYYLQSEQIKTRIKIVVSDHSVRGMLIQAMPQSADTSSLAIDDEDFNRIEHLFSTLREQELRDLSNQELLYRLFHEEQVRVMANKTLAFQCGCSRHRSAQAVFSLGIDDAKQLIKEQGKISVDCQFCFQHYSFKSEDLPSIFSTKH